MNYSHPLALKTRRIGQKLGVLRPIAWALERLSGADYERAFDKAMMEQIAEGDTVWDIGANVGYYTQRFAERVALAGIVVAFEPSPATSRGLISKTANMPNVRVNTVALSKNSGEATFYSDPSGNSPLDGLSPSEGKSVETKVAVCRGDDFLEQFPPMVIKIDVEGYEYEVLQGMPKTLRSSNLRAVLIEVHFLLLGERGRPNAPSQIVDLLTDAGFRVKWPDSSHICAVRGTPGRGTT